MNHVLIVGLGNPGSGYRRTRHNVGFRVVDALLDAPHVTVIRSAHDRLADGTWFTRDDRRSTTFIILKPETYMNDSGRAVQPFVAYHRIPLNHLWVVHDDLDLPFGQLRASFDSGPAGHRGVTSIIEALGSKAFHRLRLGIGHNRERGLAAEDYVLQRFTDDEERQLAGPDGVISRAVTELLQRVDQAA